jgi:hypothetical protein
VAEYLTATRAFRLRYPYVKLYTAWNEANNPVGIANTTYASFSTRPFLAGQLWDALDRDCQQCVVAAGSFLDSNPNLNGRPKATYDGPAGNKTYFGAYVQGMGRRRPPAWAYHAYWTINHLNDSRLRDFVIAARARRPSDGVDVSPSIWLTEQGAYLRLGTRHNKSFNAGPQRQQRAVRFLVGNPDRANEGLVNRYPRISRVYYYLVEGSHRIRY